MTDILIERGGVNVARLNTRLAAHFGAHYRGLSTGRYGVRVHLAAAPSTADVTWAETIVNAHRSLTLTADQRIIPADGVATATITCADAAIAFDAAVTYTVWLDDGEYTAPTSAPVTDGQVQLALMTEDAGTYRVEIARQGSGNYETGDITITATDS